MSTMPYTVNASQYYIYTYIYIYIYIIYILAYLVGFESVPVINVLNCIKIRPKINVNPEIQTISNFFLTLASASVYLYILSSVFDVDLP